MLNIMLKKVLIIMLLLSCVGCSNVQDKNVVLLDEESTAEKKGEYLDKINMLWSEDGIHMILQQDVTYVDPDNKKWMVPKESKVDGASIPRFLWTLIGSPFVGKHRDASVIHDYYCDVKTETWQAVHRMFYDALLTSNVHQNKAKVLYGGVLLGGPRWERKEVKNMFGKNDILLINIKTKYNDDSINDFLSWIETNDPDLSTIDNEVSKYIETTTNKIQKL